MILTSIYSTHASRQERLNYFAYTIENGHGRSLAFQSLDKKDRITLLAQCKIKGSIVNWNKIGNQTLRKAVQYLLHGPKLPNLMQWPPKEMIKEHLTPFLTGKDLANLQSMHKAAPELGNASLIIKKYGLATLIARYCLQDCETLSEGGKSRALHQLMSMMQGLSKLEQLELPSYGSVGQFFELVEARNLLRMAAQMRMERPLVGLEEIELQIAEECTSTLQRAEAVRAWFGQHQGVLQGFITLKLGHLNLTLLPPEIGQLGALTHLDLDHNCLTSLPKEIGQLGALKGLWLQNNLLATLPKEIGQFGALTHLFLQNNRLISLPKEIGQLGALIMLGLHYNLLTSLPKEIGQLGALTHLGLHYNLLASLPKEIGLLRTLSELRLDNNRLKSLPKEIRLLGALILLWLNNNRLRSLPKEIGELKGLKDLQAKGNGLLYLPARLERFSDQLKEQNQTVQMKTMLNQLRRCLKGKHDCDTILGLLDIMKKTHGEGMCSKLHACMYEVCKKKKSLHKKLQGSQFGRIAFIDPAIDPKFKRFALKRFKKMLGKV